MHELAHPGGGRRTHVCVVCVCVRAGMRVQCRGVWGGRAVHGKCIGTRVHGPNAWQHGMTSRPSRRPSLYTPVELLNVLEAFEVEDQAGGRRLDLHALGRLLRVMVLKVHGEEGQGSAAGAQQGQSGQTSGGRWVQVGGQFMCMAWPAPSAATHVHGATNMRPCPSNPAPCSHPTPRF